MGALEELARQDVPRTDVYVLTGEDGVRRLDPSGRLHGWRGRVERSVETVASAGGDIEDACQHVAAGGSLVAVRAHEDDPASIAQTLRDHGGHAIQFFGPVAVVELSN